MKKLIYLTCLFLLTLTACNNNEKRSSTDTTTGTTSTEATTDSSTPENFEETAAINTGVNFDTNALPEAKTGLGAFPYYTIPDWLMVGNYSNNKELDFSIFEVFTGQGFYPIEGKVSVKYFNVKGKVGRTSGEWNEYKFVKSFTSHFESIGAKKIWEGALPQEAIQALNKEKNKDDYYAYDYSSAGMQEKQVVYGLKNAGKMVFFIVASNSAYGSVAVVENAMFEQTISMPSAGQIQKDLAEKGKSVLHINFDTDKATLKPDGKEAVAEITKALQADKNLKIVINGYTDNTGTEMRNLQLSKDRANTVLNTLVSSGINKVRLSAQGFGDKNPIADNAAEDGKAQNRRVELVKV